MDWFLRSFNADDPLPMLARAARSFIAFVVLASGVALAHGPAVPADAPVLELAGRIQSLIVEDPARNAVHRIPVLVTDGERFVLRGADAERLADGSLVVVRARVSRDTASAEGIVTTGLPETRAAVAKAHADRTWTGRLQLGHADNFDGQPSYFFYSLIARDGATRELELAAATGVLANGMRVSVEGDVGADGGIVPDRIVVEEDVDPDLPPQAKATTNQVLVLPIKFKNAAGAFPADPFTITAIQNAVFGASSSAAHMYSEMSYGQQLLSGQVANDGGAFLQGADAAPEPAACNYGWIASQAEAAATAKGYNLANYQNIVYVFSSSGFNCGWAGLAYVGWGRAWIKNTTSLLVLVHELGHNFGLLHAGSLDCGTEIIGGSCSAAEYGDPFDVMGNQRAMHFNAMQKRKLNWIADTTTPTHASGTTTFNLSPIETGGQVRYAVRVPAATNRTYWIEYRQPIGYDSALSAFPNNGAQIRVASPFEVSNGSDDTQFLDMTPATAAFTDGALVAGQSFTDSLYGMTINVLSASPGSLSVEVTKTGLYGTTTQVWSSVNPANEGQPVTLTANVTGIAPTGGVAFRYGATSIAGCSAAPLTGTGDVRSATCTTSALPPGSLSITAVYSGDGANASSTSSVLTLPVKKATTAVVASSLNPSTVGQSVTFTATVTGTNPTGNVNFRDNGTSIAGCSAVALAGSGNSRTAACTTTALPQGNRSISAIYAGDAGNTPSTSATLSQVVNTGSQQPTTTTIASSLNPSVAGQSVSLTATVTGNAPTGSVLFRDGATTIAGCSAVALTGSGNARTAVCTSSALATGTRSITANYGGNASNAASTSSALAQVVKTVTTTALVSSANPSTVGQSVTFTATVTGTNPTGNVAFRDGASNLCAAVALTGSGNSRTAACSTSALAQGTRSISAVYAGDAANATSTSTTLSQTVNAAGGGGSSVNVARASNGGTASASSSAAGYSPAALINGELAGANWSSGGGWKDDNRAFPDSVDVVFNGTKTVDRVVVYSIQDNWEAPVAPTDAMTFAQYGVTDFQVQRWTGAAWVSVATVAGNNLVKRTVTFAAVSTDRIRILITNALNKNSRLTEIEAWTAGSATKLGGEAK